MPLQSRAVPNDFNDEKIFDVGRMHCMQLYTKWYTSLLYCRNQAICTPLFI